MTRMTLELAATIVGAAFAKGEELGLNRCASRSSMPGTPAGAAL